MCGNARGPLRRSGLIGKAGGALLGDVAERIGAQIAIGFRVRRASDAKRVKNEQKCAGHQEISN
jgi:hypothetical protein